MTPEQIEAMARKAGLCCDKGHWFSPAGCPEDEVDVSTEDLTRFADLVRAQERERIAAWYAEEGRLLDVGDVPDAIRNLKGSA